MSSKKYEQLINYVINEDTERAEALFHEIVVETSRKIYENIMERDDIEEGMDTDLMQEIESEEQNGMQMDEAEDDDMEFTDTEEMDGDFEPTDEAGDDDDMPMGGMGNDADMGSGEPATKDDIMDIKDMLDEIMAAFEEEQSAGDDMDDADADMDDADADMDDAADDMADAEEDEADADDEEIAAMMEAIQLKKVSVSHTDGADGGAKKGPVAANSGKTGMASKPVNFSGGGAENGRAAPKTESMKGGQSHYQNSPGGAKGVKDGKGEAAKKPVTKDGSSNDHSPVAEGRRSTKRRI